MGWMGAVVRPRHRPLALSAGLALVAAAGLVAVTRPTLSNASAGQTRTYYIAADPVDWDYAPSGKNLLGAHFDGDAGTFLDHGDDRIGHVDRKSIYRAYTDDTFKTQAPRPQQWEHLGMLHRDDYRKAWTWKHEWYLKNGFVEGKNLFTTSESDGLDMASIDAVAQQVRQAWCKSRRGPSRPRCTNSWS